MKGRRRACHAVVLLMLLGCRGKAYPLRPPAACTDDALIFCLQPYAFETLHADEQEDLQRRALACFSEDKSRLMDQSQCLPLTMGKDSRGRGDVRLRYFCSDRCPMSGGVLVLLTGPKDLQSCCAAGGEPFIDAAWGGYKGCAVEGGGNPRACERASRAP